MKVIKFRAWSPPVGDYPGSMSPPVDLKDLAFNTSFTLKEFFDSLIFMQFTGFQERSGFDAYAGDIVKNRLTGTVGQIKWDDEAAMFCIANKKGEYICSMGAFGSDGFEIIGNIYHNPEWSKS